MSLKLVSLLALVLVCVLISVNAKGTRKYCPKEKERCKKYCRDAGYCRSECTYDPQDDGEDGDQGAKGAKGDKGGQGGQGGREDRDYCKCYAKKSRCGRGVGLDVIPSAYNGPDAYEPPIVASR